LTSDTEIGPALPVCLTCTTEVEDGTFQLAVFVQITEAGLFSIYLKSDLDPTDVPEPTSLVLFGTALFGFGVIRSRRWLRRRNYEFTA
jgi:hypothetical protein